VPLLAADFRTIPLDRAYNITSLYLFLWFVGNLTDSKQVLNKPICLISHVNLFSSNKLCYILSFLASSSLSSFITRAFGVALFTGAASLSDS